MTPAQDATALADRTKLADEIERHGLMPFLRKDRKALIVTALRATSQTPDAVREALKELVAWYDSTADERGSTITARFEAARSALSTPSASAGQQAEAVTWEDIATQLFAVDGNGFWEDATPQQAEAYTIRAKAVLALYAHPQPQPAGDPLEKLVNGFAKRLLAKLRLSRANGRSGWQRDDWEKECQQGLLRHVAKGDPRDVAAYCAFMDHHGWITVPAPQQADGRGAVIEECINVKVLLTNLGRRSDDWIRGFDAGTNAFIDALAALQQSPATDNAPAVGAHQRDTRASSESRITVALTCIGGRPMKILSLKAISVMASTWEMVMELIFKNGAIEIWAVTESYGIDYWVYGVARDPKVCPSLGMAREVAAR